MKKYRILVSFIIIMGIVLIGTSNISKNIYKSTTMMLNKNQNKDFTICIDPGHQEKGDPNLEPIAPGSSAKKARVSSGTTGVATKKPEYILNLEASMVLKHILEDKGFNVIMTRESHNVNISNAERAMVSNENEADMTIRVHADGLNDSSKTGMSILVPHKEGSYTSAIYKDSNDCAEIVNTKLQESSIKVNGIFQRNDLTGFNWSKYPVILIEMGFMSNYNEDNMMSNPDYQDKMMRSIANGVEEYLNNK